nr:hypothetical protein [Coleofasciculus sp. LEGE 07081]
MKLRQRFSDRLRRLLRTGQRLRSLIGFLQYAMPIAFMSWNTAK